MVLSANPIVVNLPESLLTVFSVIWKGVTLAHFHMKALKRRQQLRELLGSHHTLILKLENTHLGIVVEQAPWLSVIGRDTCQSKHPIISLMKP